MINLSQETEALAAQIAAAHKLPVDDAIRQALEAWARVAGVLQEPQKRRDRSPAAIARRKASIDETVAAFAVAPILDPRPISDIVDDLNAL